MSHKLAEILARKAALDAEAELVRQAELGSVIAEMRKTIAEYKITPIDLFPDQKVVPRNTVRREKNRPVKYRDEHGNTWGGGVGPRPRWVKEAIQRGEDLEKYAVS